MKRTEQKGVGIPLPLAGGVGVGWQTGVLGLTSPPSVQDGESHLRADHTRGLRHEPASGREALRVLSVLVVLLFLAGPTLAATSDEAGKSPLPRFAALRSDEVNMRTGPGTRYPIEWVYRHKDLPMEIISEFEIWRRVRDSEGAEGWVHKSALIRKRMAIVTGGQRNLLGDSQNTAPTIAHLENGAMGQIMSCTKEWCRLKFDGVKGYLRKTEFWGAYPNEVFD